MDIRSALTELCEAFNAHDLDRIMALFSDDCIMEMPRGNKPWGARCEGREKVRAALATRFEGLPDVHYGDAEHFFGFVRQYRHIEVDSHRYDPRGKENGGPGL